MSIQEGDIFYTSWGYDQTNYDFVIVEEISPSGKTALCRIARVDLESCPETKTLERAIPTRRPWGKQFRLKIVPPTNYNREFSLRGSYPYCTNQDSTRMGYFSKHQEKQVHYQTNILFGH